MNPRTPTQLTSFAPREISYPHRVISLQKDDTIYWEISRFRAKLTTDGGGIMLRNHISQFA